MSTKKSRYFYALVKTKEYKYPFELGDFVVRGGVALAREIVEEQFSKMVDESLYPKLPYPYTPNKSNIRIVWI